MIKRAVLVYADGRTSSIEAHGFGLWYVQARAPESYSESLEAQKRYFKNVSYASTEKSADGGPKLGCMVFVERSKEEFDA